MGLVSSRGEGERANLAFSGSALKGSDLFLLKSSRLVASTFVLKMCHLNSKIFPRAPHPSEDVVKRCPAGRKHGSPSQLVPLGAV